MTNPTEAAFEAKDLKALESIWRDQYAALKQTEARLRILLLPKHQSIEVHDDIYEQVYASAGVLEITPVMEYELLQLIAQAIDLTSESPVFAVYQQGRDVFVRWDGGRLVWRLRAHDLPWPGVAVCSDYIADDTVVTKQHVLASSVLEEFLQYHKPKAPALSVGIPLVYHQEDGFVVVECPDIPGCVSQGRTRDEALANIQEAIQARLDG